MKIIYRGLLIAVAFMAMTTRAPLAVDRAEPEEEGAERKSKEMLEQKPEDPAALSAEMDRMKGAADLVIERARAGSDPAMAFRQGALEICCVMRPDFGPANGWLFNERDRKTTELALKLGLSPERAMEMVPKNGDEVCAHVESVAKAARQAGFKTTIESANRGSLMWSPSPGFALTVTDPTKEVMWAPPHANMPGQPEQVPRRLHNPRFTLFMFPPEQGRAVQNLLARDQPGELWFYSGAVVGYFLLPAQAGDIEPEPIMDKLLELLKSGGLIHPSADDARVVLKAALGARLVSVDNVNGVLRARGAGAPPPPGLEGMAGEVLLFSVDSGDEFIHHLVVFE